ncbi:UrvD/REP family ATP-dependent DNA helicase [uncultured Pseudokineococcus sp.]|uniref:UrvD/REP family ATP-dependent DNA helicase n=1 Tax=uncultured Pseudokineococcus sp. TaxID=1642928 RepID=UPI00260B6136|nr:UrvD/REP family ATP-dependent DNA helicase [uncultured Pseudokineococcus sp.]
MVDEQRSGAAPAGRGRPGASGAVRLVRRPRPLRALPVDDAQQRAVVAWPPGAGRLVVLGAPGTGRTTSLVDLVAARVEQHGADPGALLLLAPGRLAAASLRDRVGERLRRTAVEPAARSWHAYAFSLLRRTALSRGEPAPRLVSGPEQDRVIADLLSGHAAGRGHRPGWPAGVLPALGPSGTGLRGLRDELRDLLMRCLERGTTAGELADLGRSADRPEWVAAASVLAEYEEVAALRGGGAHDPSALVDAAARLLEEDEEVADAERARWSLVGVDDHHEAGAAVARLLDALSPSGTAPDLVVTGDPDSTTQSFRGADPAHLAELASRSRVVVLGTRHRCGPALAAAVRRVADGVPSAGLVAQRRATAGPPPGAAPEPSPGAPGEDGREEPPAVSRAVLASVAAEGAYVAHVLREAHLLGGLAWDRMAVVVRSAGRTGGLRRALSGAGVPVGDAGPGLPVRDEPAVRPLLLALAVALDLRAGTREHLDADAAVALLTSPLGGADPVSLRRLRRRLRALEREAAPDAPPRSSDELLVALLADEAGPAAARALAEDDRDVAPAAAVLRVLRAAVAALPPPAAAASTSPGEGCGTSGADAPPRASGGDPGDAEEVLWALWSASGLGPRWREQALAGGAAGRRADRDLDAVVALFEAVARFADSAVVRGPRALLAQLAGQDLPQDTLAERAPAGGSVALLTPQAAAGGEWDLVVVAGLQDGVWPDTRVRDGLLGAQALVDLLAGRGDGGARSAGARAQVLADERRLLHVAVSRARRRLVCTAVADGDLRPSPFLDVVVPPPPARPGGEADGEVEERTRVPRQVSLPALVAELRQVLTTPDGGRDGSGRAVDEERRAGAAAELARLAAAGVPGADPDDWYGLAPLSDPGPLHPGDEPVPVSPSKVEQHGACPLRWVLEASGAVAQESSSAGVGTLVHDLVATAPDADRAALGAELDRRWHELGVPATWAGRRERARAERMLDNLAPYLATSGGRELLGTEVEVRVAVGRALLTGRVDRLERDAQGRLVVVDLKTGSAAAKAEVAEHPQLGAYQAAVEAGAFADVARSGEDGSEEQGSGAGGSRSGGARLVNVAPTRGKALEQAQAPLEAAEDPGWARALVERTAEGMAGAVFPAQDGPQCRTCPVRTSCPVRAEGRQVGR